MYRFTYQHKPKFPTILNVYADGVYIGAIQDRGPTKTAEGLVLPHVAIMDPRGEDQTFETKEGAALWLASLATA